ncbi:hypothetical protein CPJCM30710_12740 [Clostridium polyendosporum]|uniref:Uncharacterized protein n=1 Tax=Clostridium polyendosporum TaxID=69208 RepID=A0A919VLH6_9CLOT|nr:DUF3232 domain-containing protein [Clostridium polyendosporum]GIM28608.1 hypothetical protein CPJCM30710_12740 [Clostridium polyendosporum]
MIIEDLEKLANKVKSDKDELDFVYDIINYCCDYTAKVIRSTANNLMGQYYCESLEAYRMISESLDENKTTTHNTFISSIKIVDKICARYNLPLIYGKSYDDIKEINKFALTLMEEMLYYNENKNINKSDKEKIIS